MITIIRIKLYKITAEYSLGTRASQEVSASDAIKAVAKFTRRSHLKTYDGELISIKVDLLASGVKFASKVSSESAKFNAWVNPMGLDHS